MKIINISKNDSASISQQTTLKSTLLEKIKKLTTDVFSFIRKNTSCMHQSNRAISKQVNTPLDLSDKILKVLEQKNNSTEHKRDLTFITFLFNEPIYDIPTNNKPILNDSIYIDMNKGIYDIPTNNKPVLHKSIYINEPIYDIPTNNKLVLNESIYDIPTNNKPILDEHIYAEIYDVPRNNKPVFDEPIYAEINEYATRFHDKKPMMDIPPPLPPRNW